MSNISPIERAQLLLEVLAKSNPAACESALNAIRNITNKPALLGDPRAEAVVRGLPHNPVDLLKELRGHLSAIQVAGSLEEHYSVERVLKALPSAPEDLLP